MNLANWLGRLGDRANRPEGSAQLARALGVERLSVLVPWDGDWVAGLGFEAVEGPSFEAEGALLVLEGGEPQLAKVQELLPLLPLLGSLLRRELEAQADLLGHLNHALRTPMSALMGFVYILQQQTEDPDMLDGLQVISRNGAQVLEVVNDTLDFSKLATGRLKLERQPVVLAPLLEELQTTWAEKARAKGLHFEMDCDNSLPEAIDSDGGRIRQVLTQLLSNALKCTECGWVRLKVQPGLRFVVEDSGCGLDPDVQETLFVPFHQGRTRLGLPLARRLARWLGGDLQVQSRRGEGSSFIFTLPAGNTAASVDCNKVAEKVRRVLVVEDNPLAARAVTTMLSLMGCEALEAPSGEVALQAASHGRFEAVLLDLGLPDMDGWTLLKSLRGLGPLRIVALTGRSSDEVISPEEGLAFDFVLEKPATPQTLSQALFG